MIVLAVCITVKIHPLHFFNIPHQTAVFIIWNHKSLAMTGERLSVANLVIKQLSLNFFSFGPSNRFTYF